MSDRVYIDRYVFKYSEKKIAARLGLSRGDMKFLRDQLTEGEHWERTGGNGEIGLTKIAVQRICRTLESPPTCVVVGDCTLTPPPEKKKGGKAPVLALPPAPITMRVLRKVPNPRVLDAVDPHGAVHHVIVGDSAPYAYDAVFTALPSLRFLGFYEVVKPPERSRW